MSAWEALEAPMQPDTARERWRLHRAGIINVYQYENEVLHFGGGRLLLRGVNGSGKSMAMNMLLPFLLTARLGRIDAAREQSGMLKTWMLSDRDDAQPVGYLWIEFEAQGEFLVCGCGIKANRRSDTVRTWWFVTSKRPGIDVRLVERSVPLSADALRAALDGDEVFGHDRRREYRLEVERRLFGGASMEQHIGLINVVRSPRVGDRIDADLPEHLVEALPQLSEQALAEAAQPLDDLEEHRRNVDELARTSEAIRGLLDVYRSYSVNELRNRCEEGSARLAARRGCARDEASKKRAAEAAEAEVERLDAAIGGLDNDARRLRSEIAALEESRVYRDGRQLDALRDLVASLVDQRARASERIANRQQRVASADEQLKQAYRRSQDDLRKLNGSLAAATELRQRSGVARRLPGPVALPESALAGVDAAQPTGPFDAAAVGRPIAAAEGGVLERRADVDEVEAARANLDDAEERLRQAESVLEIATKAAEHAAGRLAEQRRHLGVARREWIDQVRLWASGIHPLLRAADVDAPTTAAFVAVIHSENDPAGNGGHQAVRDRLLSEAEDLVGHWQRDVAAADLRLADEQASADEAQAVVDELDSRTEPEPPRLDWQLAADHCLADLVDFAPHLDNAERAGIEAALQSSGLLAARIVNGGVVELASGELVAIIAGGVPSPLSDCLTVTVPDRLIGEVDEGLVAKLLESISWDTSSDAATAVGVDGAFRVGSLRGRYSKERAEFIGVTARRAALERARSEAAERLEQALAVVARCEAERAGHVASLDEARLYRSELPSTARIVKALAAVDAATDSDGVAEAERAEAAGCAAQAVRISIDASNALQRVAVTLELPPDRAGLHAVRRELRELTSALEQCRSQLDVLRRSVDDWRSAVGRWSATIDDLDTERGTLAKIESAYTGERTRLSIIEDSIGIEYAEVVAKRDRGKNVLEEVEVRLPAIRDERDLAVERRAGSLAEARFAEERSRQAEEACDAMRLLLAEVLETPGLLDAAAGRDHAPAGPIVTTSAGPDGLREVLDTLERLLATGPDDATDATNADGVRQSLRRRRDALGAGWDAESTPARSDAAAYRRGDRPIGKGDAGGLGTGRIAATPAARKPAEPQTDRRSARVVAGPDRTRDRREGPWRPAVGRVDEPASRHRQDPRIR